MYIYIYLGGPPTRRGRSPSRCRLPRAPGRLHDDNFTIISFAFLLFNVYVSCNQFLFSFNSSMFNCLLILNVILFDIVRGLP